MKFYSICLPSPNYRLRCTQNPSCKLVIEIEGKIHNTPTKCDRARTAKLAKYGYKELRFSNERVMNHLSIILAEIKRVAFYSLN